MIIFGIIFFAILVIFCVMLAFLFYSEGENLIGLLSSFAVIIFGAILITLISDYKNPHYGQLPTMADVPTEAHIVEIKSIMETDTIISYCIKWNQ